MKPPNLGLGTNPGDQTERLPSSPSLSCLSTSAVCWRRLDGPRDGTNGTAPSPLAGRDRPARSFAGGHHPLLPGRMPGMEQSRRYLGRCLPT